MFSKAKISTEKDGIALHFFKYISMFGLIEDSQILTSFVLSLL